MMVRTPGKEFPSPDQGIVPEPAFGYACTPSGGQDRCRPHRRTQRGTQLWGFEWEIDKRRQLANDPENLLSVYRSANRAKSATDSYEGMSPNIAHWSRYLLLRERIINKYGLTQSAAELIAVAFYRKKRATHQHWIKMGRLRRFMSRWVPGFFGS